MALAISHCIALNGIEGTVVEIEADLNDGVPSWSLLGLPDAALSESRDRVRAAIINSGENWPNKRLTVALSPASLPKRGSAFDLGVALTILSADGKIPSQALADTVVIGELSLDGRIRPVSGVLPMLAVARSAGFTQAIVASANQREAALVPDLSIRAFISLKDLLNSLRTNTYEYVAEICNQEIPSIHVKDMSDIVGQSAAKRALEVAAVGEHHLLMMGTPGAGKTMLAERLPTILAPLENEAALEVTAIHSIVGRVNTQSPLITLPPFNAPHHSASRSAIIGGGLGIPKPGAISLSHHGVLFLDEAPEFQSGILDSLREPLESGSISLARSHGNAKYPAQFLLVLAANPCPCGRFVGDGRACQCTPMAIRKYLGKLSGPLLDRIDVQILVEPLSRVALSMSTNEESSSAIRERVLQARERSRHRSAYVNSAIPGKLLRKEFAASDDGMALIHRELDAHRITARGMYKVLRTAWSIADLNGRKKPSREDVVMAYQLRGGISHLIGAA